MIEDVLRNELLDGEYTSHVVSLTQLCVIEGSLTLYGRARFSVLQEALRALELCEERYSTSRPSGPCFMVFISRKAGGASTPLVRFDVFARNGLASAGAVGRPRPRTGTPSPCSTRQRMAPWRLCAKSSHRWLSDDILPGPRRLAAIRFASAPKTTRTCVQRRAFVNRSVLWEGLHLAQSRTVPDAARGDFCAADWNHALFFSRAC